MDSLYEVLEILNHRDINGEREFFVKWNGFNDSENSWVSLSNMKCLQKIKEYYKKINLKKKKLFEQIENKNNKIILNNLKNSPPIIEILKGFKEKDKIYYEVLFKDNSKGYILNKDLRDSYLNLLLNFLEPKINLFWY